MEALQGCASPELVELLLDHGADGGRPDMRDDDGDGRPDMETPLHLAAQNDDVEVTHMLIRAEVPMDPRNQNERTPIHIACYEGHLEIVEALLDAGANAEVQDEEAYTPLHLAAIDGHTLCAQALVDHVRNSGSSLSNYVNAVEIEGRTALHLAASRSKGGSNSGLVRILCGVNDVDLQRKDIDSGSTALHLAGKAGDIEIMRILINAGADRNALDGAGLTPLDIAQQNGVAVGALS